MNKYLWLPMILLVLFRCNESLAAGSGGLGIILGSPTGITGKLWQDQHVAYDAGISFSSGDYMLIYADYLFHYPGSIKQKNQFVSELTPYIGIGGVFVMTSSDRASSEKLYGRKSGSFGLGARVPIGLEWRSPHPTLGVFAEIVPGISVAPATDILIMGGIGIRYYF